MSFQTFHIEFNNYLSYDENKPLSYQINYDSLWNRLIFKKGGCLTGGQYFYKGRFGNEACVMTNNRDWDIFFKGNQKQLTDLLITKIDGDTAKTRIHTCPFFVATESEVAIYALQRIYKFNWFDFEEFKEFKDKEVTGEENSQAWLQRILQDKKRREVLIKCWKRRASR